MMRPLLKDPGKIEIVVNEERLHNFFLKKRLVEMLSTFGKFAKLEKCHTKGSFELSVAFSGRN